jgi:glycerol-3-phosphate O-acyltransferase
MFFHITAETRIKNIQNEINSLYPFLKVEFFKDQAASRKLNQKTQKLNPEEFICPADKASTEFDIDLSGNRTVAQVKEDFKVLFLLAPEVFRKSGNMWIETSLTDDWTLEQQNKEGESIVMHSR